MTGSEFAAWRAKMNLTLTGAAVRLGSTRVTVTAWEDGKSRIPLYVALACAAVQRGLEPVGGYGPPPKLPKSRQKDACAA